MATEIRLGFFFFVVRGNPVVLSVCHPLRNYVRLKVNVRAWCAVIKIGDFVFSVTTLVVRSGLRFSLDLRIVLNYWLFHLIQHLVIGKRV